MTRKTKKEMTEVKSIDLCFLALFRSYWPCFGLMLRTLNINSFCWSWYYVFSTATQSVGLLSYTFLRTTGQDDVIVPMVSGLWLEITLAFVFSLKCLILNIHVKKKTMWIFIWHHFFLQIDFDISKNWVEPINYGSEDDWCSNLNAILEWSPFSSKGELMEQVFKIILVVVLYASICVS